jgi:hypothetical protein
MRTKVIPSGGQAAEALKLHYSVVSSRVLVSTKCVFAAFSFFTLLLGGK